MTLRNWLFRNSHSFKVQFVPSAGAIAALCYFFRISGPSDLWHLNFPNYSEIYSMWILIFGQDKLTTHKNCLEKEFLLSIAKNDMEKLMELSAPLPWVAEMGCSHTCHLIILVLKNVTKENGFIWLFTWQLCLQKRYLNGGLWSRSGPSLNFYAKPRSQKSAVSWPPPSWRM